MSTLNKLKSRTEWQAFLLSVVVLLVNRFFDLGLSESDLYTLFGGSIGYGVSRGLAKRNTMTA